MTEADRKRPSRFATVLLSILAVLLAIYSAHSAIVAAFRTQRPQYVVALGVNDAQALGRVASLQLAASQLKSPLSSNLRTALTDSLKDSPLTSIALRTLALDAEIRGDKRGARELMQLSSKTSRRDLATEVWLASDSARRGKLAEVIFHYDAALSTRNRSYEHMFPPMTTALVSPEFRRMLMPLMQAKRPWVPSFISHAISYAPSVVPVTRLLAEAGSFPHKEELRPMIVAATERLLQEGRPAEARTFAMRVLGASRTIFEEPSFVDATVSSSAKPFSWSLSESADLSAYHTDDNQLEIRTSKDNWTQAAARTFIVDPGRHQVAFSAIHSGSQPVANQRWTIRCNGDSSRPPLLDWQSTNDVLSPTWRAEFAIPNDCGAVRVTLLAKSSIEAAEASVTIRDFDFSRVK